MGTTWTFAQETTVYVFCVWSQCWWRAETASTQICGWNADSSEDTKDQFKPSLRSGQCHLIIISQRKSKKLFGSQFIVWRCNYTVHYTGHYENCSRPGALHEGLILNMRPAVFFAEEIPVEPTAPSTSPPHLCWFYQRTKDHTAIHCIRVTSCYGCDVLSEWIRTGRAAPK